MKVTGEYNDSCFLILNKGRVIAKYATYYEYRDAWDRLARWQAQVDRPEVFCDCNDIGQPNSGGWRQ